MSIAQNFPEIVPSLSLDFARTGVLDPRVTFSRASSATFYGKTVAKAEENLLKYSQEFDNAVWAKTNTTVSSNVAVAPNGTSTADKLVETAVAGSHVVLQTFSSSAILTHSVYVKAAERNWLWMYFQGYTSGSAWFNLSTGATGTVEAGVTASILPVGDGWYRCSITKVNATSSTGVVLAVTTGNNTTSYTGDGTSGLFVWGAQLEARSSVTAYTPTITQAITNYVPVLQTAAAGVARFDHDPVTGESLGLLIEEQRTNLLLRSEEFDNAAWGKFNASITQNATTAPDGTLSADKLIATAVSGDHRVSQSATMTAGTVVTFSFYAKSAEYLHVAFYAADGNVGRAFDLTNGTLLGTIGGVAPTSSEITPVGNGWYRCSVTWTQSAGIVAPRIYAMSNSTTTIFTGDGFSGIYIWGAQLEAGAFPTSYIKTEASQVTRSADAASLTGTNFSSWYRADEGTVYAESLAPIADRYIAEIRTPQGNDDFRFGITAGLSVYKAGLTRTQVTVAASANPRKDAVSISSTGAWSVATNGILYTPATASTASVVPTSLVIGRYGFNNTQHLNGHIRKIAYWPTRISNTALQAITS